MVQRSNTHTQTTSLVLRSASAHVVRLCVVYALCSATDFAGMCRTLARVADCYPARFFPSPPCVPHRSVLCRLCRCEGRPAFGSVAAVSLSSRVTPNEQFKAGKQTWKPTRCLNGRIARVEARLAHR